jgi:hypothetical protein
MTQQIVDGDRYSVVYVRATEANPLPVNIGSATLSVTADGVRGLKSQRMITLAILGMPITTC